MRAVTWNFTGEFGPLAPAEVLDDQRVAQEVQRIEGILLQRGVVLSLHAGVPPREVYDYLRTKLGETEFEFLAPGSCWYLDGCTGYCPECFQRAWCEVAESDLGWDEEPP